MSKALGQWDGTSAVTFYGGPVLGESNICATNSPKERGRLDLHGWQMGGVLAV